MTYTPSERAAAGSRWQPPGDESVEHRQFHAHLDACEQCRDHPMALCPVGARLLRAAVDEGHA